MQGSSGERDIENRLTGTEGGEERVRRRQSNMETYITICKIESQWEFTVWLRKLIQGFQGMGWGGRWEGASKGRGYMYTYG